MASPMGFDTRAKARSEPERSEGNPGKVSNSIFCRRQKINAQKEKAMMEKFIFQNHCLLFAGITNGICLK